MAVTAPTRTNINSQNQIYFCNSPIFLNFTDTNIESVIVYLWFWNGAQNQTLGDPTITLSKNIVSQNDGYITINVADYLKSFLIGELNQPNIAWNELTQAAMTGQAMYWQYKAVKIIDGIETENESLTNLVTLGNRWNYEQNAIGNNGITPYGSFTFPANPIKNYNPKVANYFNLTFDLTTTVATSSTDTIILKNAVTPINLKCSNNPCIIVYLNKLGLWEIFTPTGKLRINSEVDFEVSERGFRNPSAIDNTYTHSKMKDITNVKQSYVVNTGMIDESNGQCVEEIILSPKVYLIRFLGDVYYPEEVGITVDSTYITVDDTTITVDSTTVGVEDVGFYKTFQQIPVVVTDTDFYRKTRVNEKTEIDYNIKLEETNSKINNIR